MKKILSIIASLAISIMAFAQNYEYTGWLGMPYVSVNGGAISSLNVNNWSDFYHNIRPTAGLELGTYFTPVWGASVEGVALFNTTGSYTFVNQSSVFVNSKVNLSNLFGGYEGKPYLVEFVAVPAIGWGHDYGEPYVDRNYLNYKAGLEVNFNLGKQRAWQVNVKPSVYWINQGFAEGNYINFTRERSYAHLAVGVTYKFGNARIKSHNFVTNDYAVSQHDYDVLKARYEECSKREPEVREVFVDKVVEKPVYEEVPVYVGMNNFVVFPIGSVVLNDVERERLEKFAKSLTPETIVHLVGSADSATGSKSRNFALAKNRANVVKFELEKLGVNVEDYRTELDYGNSNESSRSVTFLLEVVDAD